MIVYARTSKIPEANWWLSRYIPRAVYREASVSSNGRSAFRSRATGTSKPAYVVQASANDETFVINHDESGMRWEPAYHRMGG